MTYLELVNSVLRRLRENTVTTVSQSAYSQLVGMYVNDSKRQVEDAWGWEVLDTSLPVTTAPSTTLYTVTGSGIRQRGVSANITTSGQQTSLRQRPLKWMQDQHQLTTVQSSRPVYFAWSGNDGTDSKVELFPTPDGIYNISFNMTVPQVSLMDDADVLMVASEPVIAGAFARALVERGEDGGLSSSEAYSVFKSILSDYIAVESTHTDNNDCWVAT